MPPTNSKNCVARTTVYGIGEALISFSWATFARKYPLAGSRSAPTIESATWWPTPVFASAASTLRVEVSKNSRTALSSNEGEFVTSTTTCAPVSASVKPSPVIELMPCEGDAATTSWPPARRRFTTLLPMSPVPPRTTISICLFLVSDALSFITMALFSRHGCGSSRELCVTVMRDLHESLRRPLPAPRLHLHRGMRQHPRRGASCNKWAQSSLWTVKDFHLLRWWEREGSNLTFD